MNEDISQMVGRTLRSVRLVGSVSIDFHAETGEHWLMSHHSDCCESCDIEEVVGDLSDLVGSPIVMAEVSTNSDAPKTGDSPESFTWTFYKFATAKGYVTVRWYGVSNGHYSEIASFVRVLEEAP